MKSKKSKGEVASKPSRYKVSKRIDPEGLKERAALWLLCLEETLGWYYNMVYMGHTMKRTEIGWFLILRGKKDKKNLVCFTRGESPMDCVRTLSLTMKHHKVNWKSDKYN